MKKMIHQITSWFLLVTFLFAAAPKELIHEIAGHEDAVDLFDADLQVGTFHIHCCSLQLSLPPFIGSPELSLPSQVIELFVINSRVKSVYIFSAAISSFGRGPPLVA